MSFREKLSHSRRLRPALLMVLAMACAPGAMAGDYGAVTSGTWGNALTWTPSSAFPGSGDNAYIGSNHPTGAAATASVTLGGNQSVSNVYLGYGSASSSGTLNLAGNHLAVNSNIYFGQNGGTGTIVENGGSFSTQDLYLYLGNSLALSASDTISNLDLSTSSLLITSTTGNVTSQIDVTTASKLILGADMHLSNYFNLQDSGSTLDMGGHKLTAPTIYLNYYGGISTLLNRGPLIATNLRVDNQPFSLAPGDSVTNFYLTNVSGSTLASNAVSYLDLSTSSLMTTTTTGNVTSQIDVTSASKLILGADVLLSNYFSLQDSGSKLDMGGHKLTAPTIYLNYYGSGTSTLLNRGPLIATSLRVDNQPFSLAPADSVTNFYLTNVSGSTLASNTVSYLDLSTSSLLTTTTTGNVTSQIDVTSGSKLILGADMLLSNYFSLQDSGSTLDMGGHKLTAPTIYLNYYGSGISTLLNRGPLTATTLRVDNQSFSLAPADSTTNFYLTNVSGSTLASNAVSYLDLSTSSLMTTTTTGNVTSQIDVTSASKLILGADVLLSNYFSLQDSGSKLDMGGHKLTAPTIYLNYYGSGTSTLLNRGPLIATSLRVDNQPFSLAPADSVTNFYLTNVSGSTLASNTVSYLDLSTSSLLTTTTTGNVTSQIDVTSGSKLILGADMLLSNYFSLQDSGSTLDMGGHKLTAPTIYLNYYGGISTLLNRGPLTATTLRVDNQPFSLAPGDSTTNFYLTNVSGSTLASNTVSYLDLSTSSLLTTTTTGNVTNEIDVTSGSKLTLGADVLLSNQFDLQDSGSTLDMGGHKITAPNILLNYYGGVSTLLNRGPLIATNLRVDDQPFSLAPADSTTNFYLTNVSGSTMAGNAVSYLELSTSSLLTTTTTGNVTGSIDIYSGSKLTMGAGMVLSNYLNLENTGSTLDMGDHKLTANNEIELGWNGSSQDNVVNPGEVATNNLFVGHGSAVPLLAASSTVNSQIMISGNSVLTLQQPTGQLTGLTFYGSSSASLSINDTSVLQLSGGSNSGPCWIFRWQDPTTGTWEKALTGSIAAGRIAVSSTAGYSVFDEEGYTYVATPSTLIWNGGGGNTNWSTSGNWNGAAPTAGHWLRFGALAGGGHTANNNDLAASSLFYGIFFDAAAPSYNLQGNAIQLSGDVLNQSGTNQAIGLNIQLVPGDGAFNTNTIAFDTGAKNITDSGSISGSGMALMKTGTGTLVLSPGAPGNTYSGGTIVTAGKLIVTTPYGILDGTNLTVGANALAKFAAPVVGAPTASGESTPSPAPEPGALALLAAILVSAAAWRVVRKR